MNEIRREKKSSRRPGIRICSLILAVVMFIGIFGTASSAEGATTNVINYNVSTSKVTNNATNGSLPTAITTVDGNTSYYFNLQVSSDLKIKTAQLYVMFPGETSYSCEYSKTASSVYFRYTYKNLNVGSTEGTLKYYWKLTYTSGSTKTTSAKSITVKNEINQNISTKCVSTNASNGSLPTGTTSLSGASSYYFNIQVSTGLKIKKAQLYIMQPGESSYTNVYTKTASSVYFRYTGKKYQVHNTGGTLKYYWKLTYTDGSTETTSASSATVTATSYTLPSSLFLAQAESNTCTLCATTMMLRATMYVNGSSSWSIITESRLKGTAWVTAGLLGNFTYTATDGSWFTVKKTCYSGISLSTLKSLLDDHPEGVVLYCSGKPHAVFVTRYSGSTIYCADPSKSYAGSEITLASSLLGKYYGSQSSVLSNTTGLWMVSAYSVE